MSFHSRIQAKYHVQAGSELPKGDLLAEALDAWVYRDSPGKLETLYKTKPELFKDVDKGKAGSKLYRVVALSKELLTELLTQGKISNRDGLESWSTSWRGLQHFSDKVEGYGVNYVVTLKKSVPLSDRVICIPCMPDAPWIRKDDVRVEEEKEIIVKRKPILEDDIEWIAYPGESLHYDIPRDQLYRELKIGTIPA